MHRSTLQLLAVLALAASTCAAAEPATFADVVARHRPSDLRILDRHGEVLHETRVDEHRRRFAWVALRDVSPALLEAVVTSEDQRYYRHHGVDWRAAAYAGLRSLTGDDRGGASTITMQTAALLNPSLRRRGRRGWGEKWAQMQAARQLDAAWSKDEVLEAYLNLATFRGEIQGVGAAAHVLFGKEPHGLSRAEAIVLAALIRSPNARKDTLLRRAINLDERLHVPERSGSALDEAVSRIVTMTGDQGPRARQAAHLASQLGRSFGDRGSIATTLDAATQHTAADAIQRQILALVDRRVRDGAAIVVDNASGDVLAYVGGSGKLSTAANVDGVRARRQAGSTLKPFLYAQAVDQRILTAASELSDTPLEIPSANGMYRPENYDERFRGWVAVREALASSLNVPAVRALQLIGPDALADQLRAAGVASIDRPGTFYGPALALGSADVTLWDLVGAYRALARHGEYSPLHVLPSDRETAPRRVFSEQAAFIISDILSDRDSRSLTFGLESPLATPFWTAVKTGTSKDMRDNWCIGYSDRYTVGIWVGNFSGMPMEDVSGISGAAPAWLEIMRWLHRDQASTAPTAPVGVSRVGTARGSEWFIEGTAPSSDEAAHSRVEARIVEPTSGASFAIDPEVPGARQRIAFRADGATTALYWELDGSRITPHADVYLWAPRPGQHQLTLREHDGGRLDEVRFVVRGDRGAARAVGYRKASREMSIPTGQ